MSLDVDFRKNILSGTNEYTVEVMEDGAACFDLDTRELSIKNVDVNGTTSKFNLDKPHEALGSRLSIPLDASLRTKGNKIKVSITYSTSPQASACMWLTPEQTAG